MLDEKEISMLESLIGKLKGAAPAGASHETNDLQSSGIEELANAVKALMEAQALITQRVEEICKKIEGIEGTSSAFIGNWERLAKEKSRADGIEGFKAKHGANADYSDTARMYQESEGSDMFEVVYDLLQEAREGATNAEGAAEQAEFDEDGFVGNVFGSVKDKISKIASLTNKPAVAEIEVAKIEPEVEKKTEKVEMPSVAEQIRKSKKDKMA